jgi:hypothetical protein
MDVSVYKFQSVVKGDDEILILSIWFKHINSGTNSVNLIREMYV